MYKVRLILVKVLIRGHQQVGQCLLHRERGLGNEILEMIMAQVLLTQEPIVPSLMIMIIPAALPVR